MVTVMLVAGGLFLGGTYSFYRQKHFVGAGVLLVASVMSFAAAWMWSQ